MDGTGSVWDGIAEEKVKVERVAESCRTHLRFTVDRSNDHEAVVLFGLEAVKTVGESVG